MQRSNKTQINPPKRSRTRRGPRQQNNSATTSNRVVRAPIAVREIIRPVAMRGRAQNGTFTVHNRETFAVVQAPPVGEGENGRYNVKSYVCNPAVSTIFPWLSGIARHYETYKFKSLVFHYTPSCSTAIAGMTGLCFDLDSTDSPPASQMELLSNQNATMSSCWGSMDLRVRLEQDRRPTLYTNPASATATDGDAKTSDQGRLSIATQGVNDGTTVGMVSVEYIVELRTPQPPLVQGGSCVSGGSIDKLHLVGAPEDMEFDPHGVVPAVPDTTSTFRFLEAFEGLLYMHLVGVNLGNNVQCNVGPTAFYGVVSPVQVTTSGTETIAVFRLKVSADATIAPSANDVTAAITGAEWAFAPCPYDGLSAICQ